MGIALILWVLLAQPPAAATQWKASYDSGVAAIQDDDYATALGHLNDALKQAETFGRNDPRLVDTLSQLAKACNQDDDCADADKYLTRALELRGGIRAPDARYADTLATLAEAASWLGKYDDALKCYQQAIELRERAFGLLSQQTADTYAATAWVNQWKQNPVAAREAMKYAVLIVEKSGKVQTPEFAALLEDNGQLLAAQADEAGAIAKYDRAMAIRNALWKPGDPRIVEALTRIAGLTSGYKDTSYAERLYRRAIEIELSARSFRSREYYDAQSGLGELYGAAKRWRDAEIAYGEALRAADALGDENASAEKLYAIAAARYMDGRYNEAVDAAERSAAIRNRTAEPGSYKRAWARVLLVQIHAAAGDFEHAEEQLQSLQEDAPAGSVITAAEVLGEAYQKAGRYVEAVPKFELAAATYEAKVSATGKEMADKIMRLAQAYQLAGRPADANRVMMRANRIRWDLNPGAAIAAVAVLFVVFPVVTGVFVLIQTLLSRHLTRKTAKLFEPPPAYVQPPVASPAIPDSATVDPACAYAAAATQGDPGAVTVADAGPQAVAALEEAQEAAMAAAMTEQVPTALQVSPDAVAAPPLDAQSIEASQFEQAAVPLETPQPPAPLSRRLSFHGDGGTLFGIRIANLLLSICTLGVYYFWGKAKIRRYVYGQTEFEGDRFEFHGTGKEMLFGWLKAMPIIAFVVLLPRTLPLIWQSQFSILVAQLAVAAVVLILWPLARAGAYRYRLNRTSWRGIRFSFRGSTRGFLWLSFKGYALSLLTLGIYYPFFVVRARRYLLDQTWFGNAPFRFEGRGRDLLPVYLFTPPLMYLTLGIGWLWWNAICDRYNWAHTIFAGARCRCTITAWKLFKLYAGNIALLVFTLTLAAPWVIVRTMRFWTENMELVGGIDLAPVVQNAQTVSAVGEGFADFFGFDFGL